MFLQELFRSELLYFSEDDFVDIFVPPYNTYVQFHSFVPERLICAMLMRNVVVSEHE